VRAFGLLKLTLIARATTSSSFEVGGVTVATSGSAQCH
jgi:hypothetical protein